MIIRCSSCILPSNLPGIKLDESGKCNYCFWFEKKFTNVSTTTEDNNESELVRILDKYRGKHSYDCLVPVSGGKDSMYVMYVISSIYKMNVLAYNFDNGFQSSGASKNIQRAVKKLGVDFIQYKPGEEKLYNLYRTFLSETGDFCAPCNTLIGVAAIKFARQHGIALIISGSSDRWSAAIKGMSISRYANLPYYKNVVKGKIESRDIQNYIPEHPMLNYLRRKIGRGPMNINMFNYYNPMKNQLLDTLKEELGWEAPSGELEHGDCLLNPIKDYIVCKKWGFSEKTGAYSALVRNGKITREEAIDRAEEEEVRNPPAALELFLNKIGMPLSEFEESITNRHFTDINNTHGILYRAGKYIRHLIR